jgi:hypothetical protein
MAADPSNAIVECQTEARFIWLLVLVDVVIRFSVAVAVQLRRNSPRESAGARLDLLGNGSYP